MERVLFVNFETLAKPRHPNLVRSDDPQPERAGYASKDDVGSSSDDNAVLLSRKPVQSGLHDVEGIETFAE